MPVTFQSIRFGAVEVPQDSVIEFPLGLIGLGGLRYVLLDRNPERGSCGCIQRRSPRSRCPS